MRHTFLLFAHQLVFGQPQTLTAALPQAHHPGDLTPSTRGRGAGASPSVSRVRTPKELWSRDVGVLLLRGPCTAAVGSSVGGSGPDPGLGRAVNVLRAVMAPN